MKWRILTLAGALVLTLSAAVWAEQKTVILKDGRRFTGEVTKTATGYEIRLRGSSTISFPINIDQVLRVEDVADPLKEYRDRLAKVSPNDPEALYQLADWAVKQDMYAQGRELLDRALKIKPDHENSRLLLKLVEMKMASGQTTPGSGPGPRPLVGPTATRGAEDKTLLDRMVKEEDIYRMRLMEVKPDERVLVEFRNSVLERFIKANRGQLIFAEPNGERTFTGWPNARKARYILDNTDRESFGVRDDILIKADPQVFRDFRTVVWPVVRESCATSTCHGGAKGAGRLKLYDLTIADDRVLYTNFYILTASGRGDQPLVNRASRENSLLLQHGLPRDLARSPHPQAIAAPFTSREDKKYRLIDEWIGTLRYPFLEPGYRVNYQLSGQSTTEPAPK